MTRRFHRTLRQFSSFDIIVRGLRTQSKASASPKLPGWTTRRCVRGSRYVRAGFRVCSIRPPRYWKRAGNQSLNSRES